MEGQVSTSRVTTDYSFSQIPEELLYDPTINTTAKCIYAVLFRHGVDPDSCYPSHQRIAGLLGLSKRSIQRPLKALVDAGWIEAVPRLDPHGGPSSNGYHVHARPISPQATPSTQQGADPRAIKRAPSTRRSAYPPRTEARTLHAQKRAKREPVEREPLNESPQHAGGVPARIPKGVDPADVERLNALLALRVKHHRGRGVKITAQWAKAMGTLLNSGPADVEDWAPTPLEVEQLINMIFNQLADRDRRGFCWADQVQSADALRRHWSKCALELRHRATVTDGTTDESLARMRALDAMMGAE